MEERLFPATFLRRPIDGEEPRVVLRVALVEKYAEAEEDFPLSYLVFTLEGQFDWAPPAGLELRWPLRMLKVADRKVTDVLIERDVLERADEIKNNANMLVRSLLCHVPVFPSPSLERTPTAALYHLERPKSQAGLKLVLPFREEELGLLRGSEFLVRTEASWGEAEHYLVYKHALRYKSPRQELAYLEGGLVLGPADGSEAPSMSTTTARPEEATFVDRAADVIAQALPLSDHEPLENPPVLLRTVGVQVLRAVPADIALASPAAFQEGTP